MGYTRQRIPTKFAEGTPVRETLPCLTPLPGSTPDAVVLSGAWDTDEEKAALAWSEITDTKVVNLQLCATVGPDYDADEESVIADFPPGATPSETLQSFGLAIEGASANFKLYSLTADGNQKGSNAVTIERPVVP